MYNSTLILRPKYEDYYNSSVKLCGRAVIIIIIIHESKKTKSGKRRHENMKRLRRVQWHIWN